MKQVQITEMIDAPIQIALFFLPIALRSFAVSGHVSVAMPLSAASIPFLVFPFGLAAAATTLSGAIVRVFRVRLHWFWVCQRPGCLIGTTIRSSTAARRFGGGSRTATLRGKVKNRENEMTRQFCVKCMANLQKHDTNRVTMGHFHLFLYELPHVLEGPACSIIWYRWRWRRPRPTAQASHSTSPTQIPRRCLWSGTMVT